MKIPESFPRFASNDPLARSMWRGLQQVYGYLVRELNGGQEIGVNFGCFLDGTFDVAANTDKDFTHTLGRPPKFIWTLPRTTNPVGVIYTTNNAYLTQWTTTNIRLRINVATDVNNVRFLGYVI